MSKISMCNISHLEYSCPCRPMVSFSQPKYHQPNSPKELGGEIKKQPSAEPIEVGVGPTCGLMEGFFFFFPRGRFFSMPGL